MRGFKYLITFLAVSSAAAMLSGCGKKTAPEPPLSEQQLTIQIFNDLKAKRRQSACSKLSRLIALDKNNTFLYELRSSEQNNIYIDKVKKLVAKNDFAGAVREIEQAEIRFGRNPQLKNVKDDLLFFGKVKLLVQQISDPANGKAMEKSCIELKKLIVSYKPAAKYLPLVESKLELAKLLQETEDERAVFSIYSDIIDLSQSGDSKLSNVLMAELDVLNPDKTTWSRIEALMKATAADKDTVEK